MSRLGYQKKKHRVVLAPTPEKTLGSQDPTEPSPGESSAIKTPVTANSTNPPTAGRAPTPPVASIPLAAANAPCRRANTKRKREEEKLKEEWRDMYWFRGMRMEAVLEDYGSSYDSHFNKRVSRRIAQRLLLAAG